MVVAHNDVPRERRRHHEDKAYPPPPRRPPQVPGREAHRPLDAEDVDDDRSGHAHRLG